MPAASRLDQDTRAYLRSTSRAILRCRLRGHAWDPSEDDDYYVPTDQPGVVAQPVHCVRCGSGAWDFFDKAFRKIGNSVEYVDGYRRHGHGRLPRETIRQFLAQKSSTRKLASSNGSRRARERLAS